jgi:hypothetical protein
MAGNPKRSHPANRSRKPEGLYHLPLPGICQCTDSGLCYLTRPDSTGYLPLFAMPQALITLVTDGCLEVCKQLTIKLLPWGGRKLKA